VIVLLQHSSGKEAAYDTRASPFTDPDRGQCGFVWSHVQRCVADRPLPGSLEEFLSDSDSCGSERGLVPTPHRCARGPTFACDHPNWWGSKGPLRDSFFGLRDQFGCRVKVMTKLPAWSHNRDQGVGGSNPLSPTIPYFITSTPGFIML
jgi:hypothetical protein